jgi:P27 family predicted phage terminase small subunit
MKPGRIPQPSNLVELRGGKNLTHRPPNNDEPKFPVKMPPCPSFLDDDAQIEWKRISALLLPIGLLTEADMMILAAYCEAYSRWSKAVQEVKDKGYYIKVKSTAYVRKGQKPKELLRRNPYCDIRDEAFIQMVKAGARLGLSPSDRTGLKVAGGKKKSKVESFMDKKHG